MPIDERHIADGYSFTDGTLFAQRDMIIFLTFSVVVVTLVAQGLSLSPSFGYSGSKKTIPRGVRLQKLETF
jgi:NhaP-type Na+/H+ or K+/H+ antiporter